VVDNSARNPYQSLPPTGVLVSRSSGFGDSAEQPRNPDQRRAETAPLPDGLTFRCRILTPLDDSAAAGNVVEARLLSPLTASDGIVLAPPGA
jgi:hypothetical protein